jgi:hypothetical protein
MKKGNAFKTGSSQIRSRIEKLCDKIAWLFEMPSNQGHVDGPELFNLIDKISPWQELIGDKDSDFDKLSTAMHVSFGFGYTLGQILDLPEVDITPIKDLLRKEKALIYLPHEKAA